MSNFSDLFNVDRNLELDKLIEPLMRVIKLNLNKQETQSGSNQHYLNIADFSFIWDLVSKKRITGKSALAICDIMQHFMLKSDGHYRTVAEKIFFKLIYRYRSDDNTQMFLNQHVDEAIYELQVVDALIKATHQN